METLNKSFSGGNAVSDDSGSTTSKWDDLTNHAEAPTPTEKIHNYSEAWNKCPTLHVLGEPIRGSNELEYTAIDEISALGNGMRRLNFDLAGIDTSEDGYITYYGVNPFNKDDKMRMRVDLTNATTEFGFSKCGAGVIPDAAGSAFSCFGINIYNDGKKKSAESSIFDPPFEENIIDLHNRISENNWSFLDGGYTEDKSAYCLFYELDRKREGKESMGLSIIAHTNNGNIDAYIQTEQDPIAESGINDSMVEYLRKTVPQLKNATFRFRETYTDQPYEPAEAPDYSNLPPLDESLLVEYFTPIRPKAQGASGGSHIVSHPSGPIPGLSSASAFSRPEDPPHTQELRYKF